MYVLKILYHIDYAENNVNKIEQNKVDEGQACAF